MHLKRVNAKGFKSFADRTELTFKPGVSVIVGPNGSGKSNIVDAIIWVMSAAPPSGLRAESNQDVLFLGSTLRPAAPYSEVELVFDNTCGTVKMPYSEISIKRRLERAGESTYYINGNVVRRMDITELLGDTGLGKDMHSIIGQGKVDRLLSAKPADRRAAIEEAAGLGKYKRRRRRTQLKLNRIRRDLNRVADIESEMARQMRPLQRQARNAEKYSQLLAERWKLQLVLHKDDVRRAGESLNESQEKRTEARESVRLAEKAAVELRTRRQKLDSELKELMESTEHARSLLQQFTSAKDRLTMRHGAFEERSQTLRRQASSSRVRSEAAEIEAKRTEAEAAKISERSAELEERLATLNTRREQILAELQSADEIIAREKELSGQSSQTSGKVAVLIERERSLQEQRAALTAEVKSIASQQAILEERIERAETAAKEAAQRSGAAKQSLDEAHTKQQAIEQAVESSRTQQAEAHATLVKNSEQHARAKARIEDLTKRIERAKSQQGEFSDKTRIASCITADSGYEHAAIAALADDAEAIIATSSEELLEIAARAAGSSLKAVLAQANNTGSGSATIGAPLSDHVQITDSSIDAAAREAIAAQISRARVVRNLADAARELAGADDSCILVTKDGVAFDTARNAVWSVGEETAAAELTLNNELAEAKREANAFGKGLSSHKDTLDRAGQQVAVRVKELETARQTYAELQAQWSEQETFTARATAELDGLKTQAQNASDRATRRHNDEETLAAELATVSRDLREARETQELIHAELDEVTTQLEAVRAQEQKIREEAATLGAEVAGVSREREMLTQDEKRLSDQARQARDLHEKSVASADTCERLASLAHRAAAAVHTAAQALKPGEELVQQASAGQAGLKRVEKERKSLEEEEQSVIAKVAEARNLYTSAEVIYARAEERVVVAQQHVEKTLHEYREHVDQSRAVAEAAVRERQELGTDDETTETEESEDLVTVEYVDIDTDEDIELDEDRRAEIAASLDKLTRKVERLGPINPLAAREYAEQSERYDEINEQVKDLSKAVEELDHLINDLDTTIAAKFNDTFAAVAAHFEKAIPALFPGGTGKLKMVQLVEPAPAETGKEEADSSEASTEDAADRETAAAQQLEDLLADAGVEIVVKPAGKPAGKLGILSGGEKSLVAIAFLFSLFLANPSPFYVLDEVEAALDDANIIRFLSLLEKFRDQAQFIIITHQVRTMESADVLYGVTMQNNSGISSVIARKPKGKRLLEGHQPLKGSDIAATPDDFELTPQIDGEGARDQDPIGVE